MQNKDFETFPYDKEKEKLKARSNIIPEFIKAEKQTKNQKQSI